ncbi:MAG: chromosome condensation regulator [Hyperionvirus sp.]|uniref:Chromosome condensation regulator n=1 Tax=Hyperionvirus sp. TaxID=2487770 RepID=A0A3G5AEA6_9VIRU|nr:MAG: chromosome condensation regulator [Hyperionvirus sp.]
MDLISLIENLPIDLRYIVTNYDPGVIFLLDGFARYDWFKLIRMNFSLVYQRDECTNEEIMRVYLDNCHNEKSKIVCGDNYSTILKLPDGTLMSCGDNTFGQLGLGDGEKRNIFCEIKGISKNIVEVICCNFTTTIRLSDGTLMGCGVNNLYRNGAKHFIKINGIPKHITQTIRGPLHTIMRLMDGTLMARGDNRCGQLGLGDTINRDEFSEIRGIPKNIAKIVCGKFHTILVLTDGTLMSCGSNASGQLGFGDTRARHWFEKIKGIGKNIAEVICGSDHTIIRLTDGTLMSCGYNRHGTLGLGDYYNRMSFEKIEGIPKIW